MTPRPAPAPAPAPAPPIPVSIVEDHPLYREALARVLEDPPLTTVRQAVRTVRALTQPPSAGGVVVLDYHLPDLSGMAAIRAVVEQGHRVLVVSAATTADTLDASLRAGAAGYLPKSAEADQIRWAVRTVAQGSVYISPAMARVVDRAPAQYRATDVLTEREKQVLHHLAEGGTDAQIADTLTIGVRTVRTHLDRIRAKTGHRRRPDLTRLAIADGLLDCRAPGRDAVP